MKKQDERFEALLCDSIAIRDRMATDRAKLNLIENELEHYFPKRGPLEQVSCEFGTVVRLVSEDIFLDPSRAHMVMEMLGSQFPEYFTTVPCCRPTQKGYAALSSADSHLAEALRPYVTINPKRVFAFTHYNNPLTLVPGHGSPSKGAEHA